MAQTYRLPMFEALLLMRLAVSTLDQRKSVPSTHMRWRMTASLRANATCAFFYPFRTSDFDLKLP